MARVVLLVTAVASVAAVVVFLITGLDDGDHLASMIAAVAGIAGLGLAVHQLLARRRPATPSPNHPPSKYNVHVTRSWFVSIGDGSDR